MAFTKATKQQSFLRMALIGPSGSGKTYTALNLATAIANQQGKRVAVLDTEHGSASKYSDIFDFDCMLLENNYHPKHYIEAIKEAESNGYAVIILDSLTHAWNGAGGVLEVVENEGKRLASSYKNSSGRSDTFGAWRVGTLVQNQLVEAILAAKIHIIATMRAKTDYAKNDKGSVEKVGMGAVQRDGFEYEYDVVGNLTLANDLLIEKTRCSAIAGMVINKPGAELANTLLTWLNTGTPIDNKPKTTQLPNNVTALPTQPTQKQPAPVHNPIMQPATSVVQTPEETELVNKFINRFETAKTISQLNEIGQEVGNSKLKKRERKLLRTVYEAKKAALTEPDAPFSPFAKPQVTYLEKVCPACTNQTLYFDDNLSQVGCDTPGCTYQELVPAQPQQPAKAKAS
jgi:energy-coupling factor transporter ATP-binding protein EcfA2/ribosomal protein S27E